MSETFHTVGSQEYKVDHVAKKIYYKQVVPSTASKVEQLAYPLGHKWLDTAGDYDRFVARYNQPVSAEPVLMTEPLPKPLDLAPLVEDSEAQADEELPEPDAVLDFSASAKTAKNLKK